MIKFRYNAAAAGMLLGIFLLWPLHAQIQMNSAVGITPEQLVKNVLLGQGVTVSNVKVNNSAAPLTHLAIGSFQNGATTNLGLTDGLILTSGSINIVPGPNNLGGAGASNGFPGDPLLQTLIPGYSVNDACVLSFDFMPEHDTVRFRWVFGSEEYPEYVNSAFNDVFGFFITGLDPVTWLNYNNKNIALIPSPPAPPNTPVTIDNVNHLSYSQFYVANTGATLQYDGFTTVLTSWAHVMPCTQYHIRIGVADAGDFIYDSGVFLEGGSFSSGGITTSIAYQNPNGTPATSLTAIEGCTEAVIKFKFGVPLTDTLVINLQQISGTATNGVDYTWIPTALQVPAGADSAAIVIAPIADSITEGNETVMLVVPTSRCSFITGEYDTFYVDIVDYDFMQLSLPNDTTLHCGDTMHLWVDEGGGHGPFNYEWRHDTTGVGLTKDVSLIPAATHTYVIEITDACQFTAIDSVLVEVLPLNVDAGPDTSICLGESIQLSATGGLTYQWSNGAVTPDIIVSPTVTTDYIVTASNLCVGYDTVRVTVYPLPSITLTPTPSAICPGDTAVIQAVGAHTWAWTASPADPGLAGQTTAATLHVSPAQTTVYTAVGTDVHGCLSTQTVTITVKPVPTSDFLVSDSMLCIGEPTNIVFAGSAGTSAGFNWDFAGGAATGSGPGPYSVSWNDADTLTVSLIVESNGCVSTLTQHGIFVQPHPDVDFSALNTEGCPPLAVSFTHNASNVEPGATFRWKFGNGGESAMPNPVFTYTEAGKYNVQLLVTNPNGCTGQYTAVNLVHVYPVPVAEFAYSPKLPSEFSPLVKFFDRSAGNVVEWYWETGDGTSYFVPDFHHQYADTGHFQVWLAVLSDLGCRDTVIDTIFVRPDYTFYIPNAFTPDGDNMNDVFMVAGLNVHDYTMRIFNRWGQMVFESTDIDQGWDGTFNGTQAPVGSYACVILFTDVHGLRQSRYSHVMLMR